MISIKRATTLLLNGKLVAIPTETVYGLGADAKNPIAVQNIYTVKGRPATNPLIIHIPNEGAIIDWAIDIPENAWKLAKAFWPGPLTLILKRHPSVPKIVTGGQDTVALRVPNHPLTLTLLSQFGGGIAAPSANRYGRISPTTAEHVEKALGSDVDYILDGGPCTLGIESTIVSLVDPSPIILRQGSISALELTKILGGKLSDKKELSTVKVPGSSQSHYAPRQPLYLLEKEKLFATLSQLSKENKSSSVLCFGEQPAVTPFLISTWIRMSSHPKDCAQQLYQHLHILDKTDSNCILVEMPPKTPEWLAITDRLQRAAQHATSLIT